MVNLSEQESRARLSVSNADKTAVMEKICSRALRVMLPLLLIAWALLIYWVWNDGQHTVTAWRIACMVPLGISFIAIAIWAFKEWLPPPPNHSR